MMDKQKQQLIITGVLVLVLVVLAIVNIKPKKQRPVPIVTSTEALLATEASTPTKPVAAIAIASAKDLEEQKKRTQVEWGLDPFYHAVKTEIYKSSSFVLKGVSLSKDKGYVFVNDQILTIGDTIAGYNVVEVQKNKVLLSKGNEKFYLVLPEEE